MYLPNILNLRESKNWKQKQVAEQLKISQRTYSHYETGSHNVPAEILIELALLYETSVDYIVGLTEATAPYPRSEPFDARHPRQDGK